MSKFNFNTRISDKHLANKEMFKIKNVSKAANKTGDGVPHTVIDNNKRFLEQKEEDKIFTAPVDGTYLYVEKTKLDGVLKTVELMLRLKKGESCNLTKLKHCVMV